MMEWKRYSDIGLCAAIMVLLMISVLLFEDGNPVRFALAVPGLFFIPGYLFLSLLWPYSQNGSLPPEEKVAMSVAMSLIIDVAMGLVLSITSEISLSTVMAALLLSTLGMGAVAVILRGKEPAMETKNAEEQNGKEQRNLLVEKMPAIFLAFALIGASAAVIPYYIQGENTDTGFSNLYILDTNHTADNLPQEVGQNGTIEAIIGVLCMEGGETGYHLSIWFSNDSYGGNQTINITIDEEDFTLNHGDSREINTSLSLSEIAAELPRETNTSNNTTKEQVLHGAYRLGASLDTGNDGAVDNTIWLSITVRE